MDARYSTGNYSRQILSVPSPRCKPHMLHGCNAQLKEVRAGLALRLLWSGRERADGDELFPQQLLPGRLPGRSWKGECPVVAGLACRPSTPDLLASAVWLSLAETSFLVAPEWQQSSASCHVHRDPHNARWLGTWLGIQRLPIPRVSLFHLLGELGTKFPQQEQQA
jgi:hypothetical protein